MVLFCLPAPGKTSGRTPLIELALSVAAQHAVCTIAHIRLAIANKTVTKSSCPRLLPAVGCPPPIAACSSTSISFAPSPHDFASRPYRRIRAIRDEYRHRKSAGVLGIVNPTSRRRRFFRHYLPARNPRCTCPAKPRMARPTATEAAWQFPPGCAYVRQRTVTVVGISENASCVKSLNSFFYMKGLP